jgi:hypothetical protein
LSKRYNKLVIKFRGDIPCIAYVLNLVVQYIIKDIIKNDYDTSYIKDIYEEKNEAKRHETSKLYL